jgi:hypothetical protein
MRSPSAVACPRVPARCVHVPTSWRLCVGCVIFVRVDLYPALAVACGVDFTVVACLSIDYYATVDEVYRAAHGKSPDSLSDVDSADGSGFVPDPGAGPSAGSAGSLWHGASLGSLSSTLDGGGGSGVAGVGVGVGANSSSTSVPAGGGGMGGRGSVAASASDSDSGSYTSGSESESESGSESGEGTGSSSDEEADAELYSKVGPRQLGWLRVLLAAGVGCCPLCAVRIVFALPVACCVTLLRLACLRPAAFCLPGVLRADEELAAGHVPHLRGHSRQVHGVRAPGHPPLLLRVRVCQQQLCRRSLFSPLMHLSTRTPYTQ